LKILCVGQAVTDVIVKPIEVLDYTLDTQKVDSIEIKPGGDAQNTAIALAKLECDVSFCCKLGKDALGDFLKRSMEEAGIDTTPLHIVEGGVTGSALVAVNSVGQRTFYYCGGAMDTFCYEDINLDDVYKCDILHIGGTYTQDRFDGADAAKLLKLAQSEGKITSMDVTYDTKGRWLSLIEESLPHLDFFMPSINEAKHICGTEAPEEIAGFLLSRGVKNVIVKLGKDGCYFKNAEESFVYPALDVPVLDTTGAGDCFVGGFLCGLSKGWNHKNCVALGGAASAKCIQKIGATAGLTNYNDIVSMCKETELLKGEL